MELFYVATDASNTSIVDIDILYVFNVNSKIPTNSNAMKNNESDSIDTRVKTSDSEVNTTRWLCDGP